MPLLYSIQGQAQPLFESMLIREFQAHDESLREPLSQKRGMLAYQNVIEKPEREPAITAAQIMTAPAIWLGPKNKIIEAKELMRTRKFRHIPIASDDQTLLGILSDRDLLRTPHKDNDPISNMMSVEVLTATVDTPIRHIAEVMLNHRIHALPLIDADHKLIGILTTTDILRAIVEKAPVELWA